MTNYQQPLKKAIRHFWATRTSQADRQGINPVRVDRGNRSAVTGGKHLDGFIEMFDKLLRDAGLPDASIHTKAATLPGFFRPTKKWDVAVVIENRLVAAIEFKAHVGPSFGNNFNNRIEEALGTSTDLLTAFREGKFDASTRPWLGWIMLLEECPKSTLPVRVDEPHFKVFEEFAGTSYADRYAIFCERLLRERLYDGACLLLSNPEDGMKGKYREHVRGVGFEAFATSLSCHAMTQAQRRSS